MIFLYNFKKEHYKSCIAEQPLFLFDKIIQTVKDKIKVLSFWSLTRQLCLDFHSDSAYWEKILSLRNL